MNWIEKSEKKAGDFLSQYSKYVLGGLLIGVFAYFMMMASDLVNHFDGIWHPSNFIAGNWEISLGRGLQRYADRARFGIVSVPFNTILTLLLIEVANVIILKKLNLSEGLYRWLILIVLTVNPVICNSLSYSFTSVNFGLAYFFSIVAFYFISEKQKWKRVLVESCVAGLALGVSMAFYQAYICVTGVLAVLFLLKMLCERASKMHGGVIYFGILYHASVLLLSEALYTLSLRKCYCLGPVFRLQHIREQKI